MEIEIVPEPTPAQREAIVAALREEDVAAEATYASGWRRDGLGVDEDD